MENLSTYQVTEDDEEEVVFFRHPIARGIYVTGKLVINAVLPKHYKVNVYTKDGKMISFDRWGLTKFTLKKRVQLNALTNETLRVWGVRDENGRILGIPLGNIQNISVERVQ